MVPWQFRPLTAVPVILLSVLLPITVQGMNTNDTKLANGTVYDPVNGFDGHSFPIDSAIQMPTMTI